MRLRQREKGKEGKKLACQNQVLLAWRKRKVAVLVRLLVLLSILCVASDHVQLVFGVVEALLAALNDWRWRGGDLSHGCGGVVLEVGADVEALVLGEGRHLDRLLGWLYECGSVVYL